MRFIITEMMSQDLGEENLALKSASAASKTKKEDDRIRTASGDCNRLVAPTNTSEVNEVMKNARSASLHEGPSSKTRPPFLRAHTRLSIRRGRSNSRAAIGIMPIQSNLANFATQ